MRGVPEWLKSLRLHKCLLYNMLLFRKSVPIYFIICIQQQRRPAELTFFTQVHPHCDVSQLSRTPRPQWTAIGENGGNKGNFPLPGFAQKEIWQGLRWCHDMSLPNTSFWKWSNGVKRVEMDLFWCISMTNNVKSCKKVHGRAQTSRFSVFTRGRQELCAENAKNYKN